MNRKLQYLPGALLLVLGATPLIASIAIPHTFQSGETAVASEVNENFEVLRDALDSALARINELETDLAEVEGGLAGVEADLVDVQGNNALALHEHVEVIADPNILNEYTVRFSGVNVQIVNGEGATDEVNGLGNLIVGYNEVREHGDEVCSDGQYENKGDCTTRGEIWAQNHKSGSHNIVGGIENAYSQYGGLVVGVRNVTNRNYATVSGGTQNIASGVYSSINGGTRNIASGVYSSINGGMFNTASGGFSSVSGGEQNIASADRSSVSGGYQNTSSGWYSSVSGGNQNTSSGWYSSVSGGYGNTASNDDSSVSGGRSNTASGQYSSILGGHSQIAGGLGETIPAID